jgi:polyphosphate glucokinase
MGDRTNRNRNKQHPPDGNMRTLTIDIGGTGIKMLPLDAEGAAASERARELTPQPATPAAVLEVVKTMLAAQEPFDRVSVGFPGVVVRGVIKTAPNLGTEAWQDYDLRAAIAEISGKPVRVINDAGMQGYGVIDGRGVEMSLTLGTGLGHALYTDGHLVPNIELAHHPFGDKRGRSYEDRVCDKERKRIGKRRFRERVAEMLGQIQPIFNPDKIYIGGGNAKLLDSALLPPNVRLFANEEGLRGGMRLWDHPLGE